MKYWRATIQLFIVSHVSASGQADPRTDNDISTHSTTVHIPIAAWIILSVATVISCMEIYWDTSRKIKLQNERDRLNNMKQQKQLYFPSWSWARMNCRYFLCLVNVWVSITTFATKYFWVIMPIAMSILFMLMQLCCITCNAIYLRLQYGIKKNPIGMMVFYVSQVVMALSCAFFAQSVYVGWITSPYAFELFWNMTLCVHSAAYAFHYMVYWRITEKTGYSDAQLSGSITSFREMYGYRLSGIVDRCVVLVMLVLLWIVGNVYGRHYVFYAYLYPSCIIVLQISNFQSDNRNAIPVSRFGLCRSLYMRKSQEAFEEAIRHDKQNKLAEEMKHKTGKNAAQLDTVETDQDQEHEVVGVEMEEEATTTTTTAEPAPQSEV